MLEYPALTETEVHEHLQNSAYIWAVTHLKPFDEFPLINNEQLIQKFI